MTKVLMGICPICQTECVVSKVNGNCIWHTVCGKEGMPECEGSINTEPETTWEITKGEIAE